MLTPPKTPHSSSISGNSRIENDTHSALSTTRSRRRTQRPVLSDGVTEQHLADGRTNGSAPQPTGMQSGAAQTTPAYDAGGHYVAPAPLAPDLRSADGRDRPSRNDSLTAQLSTVVGGPVGDHALIGRVRFWTPMRVLLAFALVFLALGWASKAGCIQQTTTSDGSLTLDWNNGRQ